MNTTFSINEKFGFLSQLSNMVINKVSPSLIVLGEGGLGKTHTVTEALKESGMKEEDYIVFKGYSTARGLYNSLFDNNNKLIIFDDCDSILEDKVALNLLKSALDSYERRSISWLARMAKNDQYPQQFIFTGRIIFISNKSRTNIDQAILSRSLMVDLTMSADEKIERMDSILPFLMSENTMEEKEESLEFLSEMRNTAPDLNIRTLEKVIRVRSAFPQDWKKLASYTVIS